MRSVYFLALACVVLAAGACDQLSSKEINNTAKLTGGGNASAGKLEIRKYGCNSCHTISGVPGARGLVGPPLNGIRDRYYIAGELPNTPKNLMRWIQHPLQVESHTVMPEMGVTEQDSRDIAAYLYTLE
jgi:cytochrome c